MASHNLSAGTKGQNNERGMRELNSLRWTRR
jgi:hypothetical protein